jgi:hypothetical protein
VKGYRQPDGVGEVLVQRDVFGFAIRVEPVARGVVRTVAVNDTARRRTGAVLNHRHCFGTMRFQVALGYRQRPRAGRGVEFGFPPTESWSCQLEAIRDGRGRLTHSRRPIDSDKVSYREARGRRYSQSASLSNDEHPSAGSMPL